MTNVNEQKTSSSSTQNRHTQKSKDSTPLLNPEQFPIVDLTCVNRRCAGFREPQRSKIVFWGDTGSALGIHCQHCQTTWGSTGALLRKQETWNAPYYGLFVTLLSAILVWLLPTSILPWSTQIKWLVVAVCSFSAFSVLLQLIQRSQRLSALRQLGLLGTPDNAVVPFEVSQSLREQLEGKEKTLDGELKADLYAIIGELQKHAIPKLVQVKHGLGILKRLSMDSLHSKVQSRSWRESERTWIQLRLDWYGRLNENPGQWEEDVRASTDMLETIVGELESLRMGDKREQMEARILLSEAVEEGHALLERVQALESVDETEDKAKDKADSQEDA